MMTTLHGLHLTKPFLMFFSMIRFLIVSMFAGLSSVGAMHLPSKVPSPPRCGGKISNGRKQVADIRQGKRVILTSFSLLKRIVILLNFTIFVHVAVFFS